MKNREKIYSIACILFMIDQFIKICVKSNMKLLEEIKVIPKFFSIYYVENKGAAFSIFTGWTFVLIIISFISLYILDRYIKKEINFSKLKILSIGFIIGGIVGNLVDRIFYGSVIDYLSFNLFRYSAPIFNVADIGITVGAFMLIIDIVRSDINEYRDKGRIGKKN